ncbi:hypothetical protein HETIRDRAFT_426400 [Heterobasidion irregulare TC 32-1]|uniref:Uncharacterized protein n=1 Tax=Heterobasidion irregulare (strain TC 32-1) TaxID=747525 RepID=W4KCY3_HETIT|nr:uncharacterized protein HETIRDRAFT_426400 [Heterobasidion irregulare TC 32-1]ETW82926.1 hypothetical protein HETIRDRAFT_426400 [Heterobasidion irregulare TC 32-1]
MPFLGLPLSAARLCFVLSSFLHFACAAAKLVNVTIDDSGKDPVTGALIQYLPNSTFWHGSAEICNTCAAHPDPAQAFDGTWHDSAFHPTSSNTVTAAYVPFTGTAIYVFCIITHTSSSPDGNTDLQFFIDSQLVGTYRLQPTGSTVYDYNVPVYVNESLPNGLHNLTIQNGRIGGLFSLILLDKIMYRSVSHAPIIGGVVGGLAFILALGGLFNFLRRQRHQPYPRNISNFLADEGPYLSPGPSSRLLSQAPRHRPSLTDPFRIDPTLPDTNAPPPGPSKLPRLPTSTAAPIPSTIPSTIDSGSHHGEDHPTADSTLQSPAVSSSWPSASDMPRPDARSGASPASASTPVASLPSPPRQRPLRVFTRKRPRPHDEVGAAPEGSEAPPAYEDIDHRDSSTRAGQAPSTRNVI